jgi:hypothetical protein
VRFFGEGSEDVLSVRADSFVNVHIARSLLLVACYGGAIPVQVSSLFFYVHFNRSFSVPLRCVYIAPGEF